MKSSRGSAAPLSLCVVLFVLGIIRSFIMMILYHMPNSYVFQSAKATMVGLTVPLILALVALIGGIAHNYGILLIAKIGGLVILLVQLVGNVGFAFFMPRYYEILEATKLAPIVLNMPGTGLLSIFFSVLRDPMGTLTGGLFMWGNLLMAIVQGLLGLAFTFSLFTVRD